MQKLIIVLVVVVFYTASKKGHDSPTAVVPSLVGKWNIRAVRVIPLDSAGTAISTGTVYSEPPYYFFQFNSNNTWTENLSADPNSGIEEDGMYTLEGDSSFTLVNRNAAGMAVKCSIDTLTDTRLVFTYSRGTLYNGITPGYLVYNFQLER
jgi:hypothetical protein